MPASKDLLNTQQQEQVVNAIQDAERGTRGEIRLHLEDHSEKDPLLRAEEVFLKLGMEQTKDRTGVLIYVAVKDHRLAIIGDKGINDVTGDDFWKAEKDLLIDSFSKEQYAEGLAKVIGLVGEQLKKYFPCEDVNKNELPNEISFK